MSRPHPAKEAFEDPHRFPCLVKVLGEKDVVGAVAMNRDVGLQQLPHSDDTPIGPLQVPKATVHHPLSIFYQLLQHLQQLGIGDEATFIIKKQLADVLKCHPVVGHLKKGIEL